MALTLAVSGCGGDSDEGGEGTDPAAQTSTAAERTSGAGGGGVKLEKVGDFDSPVYVTQPEGSSDLYVVERGGAVKIVRDGEMLPEPFFDISEEVSTDVEQGLLSIAFAPDFQDSGLLYAYYTASDGSQRVVEIKADGDSADAENARTVLEMEDYAPNHNGGLIAFGPDGNLYIGTGDGGGSGDPMRNGQKRTTLLGKLLRIDPKQSGDKPYSIPSDNPFADDPEARPEIYSYGLRNPWRFAFDPESGTLVIGDVGQDSLEEVDIVPEAEAAGANFGWSAFEGDQPFNEDQSAEGSVGPALTYGRDQGCSITGGYVVRDPELPALNGRYVYSDFCEGQLRSFEVDGTSAADDSALDLEVPSTSSFGTDNAGHIYATSFNGPVYRLVAE